MIFRLLAWFLLGVGAISTVMSYLYASCFLCDIERLIVLAAAILLLGRRSKMAVGVLIGGWLLTFYHTLLQFGFIMQAPAFCQGGFGKYRASCSSMDVTFLNLPIPVYLLILITVCIFVLIRNITKTD